MTDNYIEFKKWLTQKAADFKEIDDVSSTFELLIEFEKEQFEKGKEEEIKTIIASEISDYSFNVIKKKVDSIYKKLKEGGLIE